MHLLRAFMHVQLEKIPHQYVSKRLCRNARKDLPFDRADLRMKGIDGETRAYRQRLLLTKAMKLVRYACMPKPGFRRAMEGLDELIGLIADLEPDIGTADLDFDDVDVSNSLHFMIPFVPTVSHASPLRFLGSWYSLCNRFILLQNIVSGAGAAVDNDACMTLSPVDADVSFFQENTCSGQVAGYFAKKKYAILCHGPLHW